MQALNDAELLADYATHRSEAAFARLVERYVALVHSAARRQVSDPHLAEEITQAVFILLARKAGSLGRQTVLAGWLCRAAHLAARDALRSEHRRLHREQLAAHMDTSPDAAWQQLAPLLDEAVAQLREADRNAIVLRYYEQRSLDEIGAALGIGADAAQKRVARALEKLRGIFTKRGVTLTGAAIAGAVSANAIQAVPVGLAAKISAAAVLAAATLASTIVVTTLQKTIIGVTLATAVGTGIYEARQAANARTEVQTIKQQQAPLAEQIQQLTRERDAAARQLAALHEDNERLNRNIPELLKLRSEVGQLKTAALQQRNDPAKEALESWLERVKQLKHFLERMPDKGIPELQLLTETDWLSAVRDANVDDDIGARQALKALRNAAKEKVASKMFDAVTQFLKANEQRFPTDLAQLKPYFTSTIGDSILQRYEILPAKDVTNIGVDRLGGDLLIAEKAPVDVDYDTRYVIGARGRGTSDFEADILIPVVRAFQSANNGQQLADPSRLLPYVQTPEQQRALQKWIQRFPSLQK